MHILSKPLELILCFDLLTSTSKCCVMKTVKIQPKYAYVQKLIKINSSTWVLLRLKDKGHSKNQFLFTLRVHKMDICRKISTLIVLTHHKTFSILYILKKEIYTLYIMISILQKSIILFNVISKSFLNVFIFLYRKVCKIFNNISLMDFHF